MKKQIICAAAGIAAGALIMFIVMTLIGNGNFGSKTGVNLQDSDSAAATQAADGSDTKSQQETSKKTNNGQAQASHEAQNPQTQTSQETQTQTDVVIMARADAVRSNSWESNGRFYAQYDITVTNDDSIAIDDWTVVFGKEGRTVTRNWNCEVEESGGDICVKPVEFNKKIEPGASAGGAGIIVESSIDEEITEFAVLWSGSAEVSGQDTQQNAAQNDEGTAAQGQTRTQEQQTQQQQTAAQPPQTVQVQPVQPAGRLHVEGNRLVNAGGEPVQLKGVSTHGLAWYPEYVNKEAFATLRDDWNANVVRLAMYTAESGGYCAGGDRDNLKRLIDNGVNYAAELGMYVIIDWHILSDNNPQSSKSDAVQFFSEMSAKYSGYDNVIYEICNEPHWVSWNNDIKPYANEVISAIRANDSNAVILVGTNTWSQDVDDVIGNRVDDDNVMYVLHFYAATHKGDLQNKLKKAFDSGIPIFVSECSICDASGNGGIDYASADSWLNLMNENNISFIAWSLSNKAETSALIRSGCNKTSGWDESDLTDTGKWFRNAIRNK